MDRAIQITCRDFEHSPALDQTIREKAEHLYKFFDRITHCRVTVEQPHKHHHQGTLFAVKIDLGVPGNSIIVDRTHNQDHAHEDAYVAVRDAFNAAEKQLKSYVEKMKQL